MKRLVHVHHGIVEELQVSIGTGTEGDHLVLAFGVGTVVLVGSGDAKGQNRDSLT